MFAPEQQDLLAYRDSVNWRSVTRADPLVQQIINTCTFSTVYIFDTVRDEWVKQKQEGPLFLVRRNKDPEYGLYMLNRATVKNVLLPLIPGEIRVTPTSDDMLIVERRGEGVKRGIHFGDGMAVVEQFRDSIISICGDVRQKTTSTEKRPEQSIPGSTTTAVDDDFQRLFGGLLKSTSSSSISHTPPAQSTYTQSHTVQSIAPPPPPRPSTPPSPPITFSDPVIPTQRLSSPPQSQTSRSPAPQTADELLNSILGVTSFPPKPVPPQALRTPPPPPPPQQLQPSPRPHQRPPHLDQPQPPLERSLNGNTPLDRGVLTDTITASLPLNFPLRPDGPEGRLAFKLDLIDLIQRDPGFVDHLHNAYTARRRAGG